MELLGGCDLATYLRGHPVVAPADARLIMTQLCHGLAAAHAVGVVHRDLKPENIFLATSRMVGMPFVVKLLDFGIAKIVSEAMVKSTVALGTPTYVAPEQTQRSALVGPQTDVWALGLIVFRLLTGKTFWRSADDLDATTPMLLREILFDPLPAASLRAVEYERDGLPPARVRQVVRALCHPGARGSLRARGRSRGRAEHPARPARRCLRRARRHLGAARPGVAHGRDGAGAHRRGTASLSPPLLFQPAAPTQVTPSMPLGLPRSREMVKLTYRDRSERTIVDAERGSTILETSLRHQIPHTHACNGNAQCTTCRVLVLDGLTHLAPRTDAEAAVARRKSWPDNLPAPLACQARIQETP